MNPNSMRKCLTACKCARGRSCWESAHHGRLLHSSSQGQLFPFNKATKFVPTSFTAHSLAHDPSHTYCT